MFDRFNPIFDKHWGNIQNDYDEVWCVFDMDLKRGEKEFADFDNAIRSGTAKGYHIAYSNDCFELWFYLHFNYTDQKNHRQFYYKALGDLWGCNYEKMGKTFKFSKDIYDRLENEPNASQEEATKRAGKLFKAQSHLEYHQQNPITTVHELVQFLNAHKRK